MFKEILSIVGEVFDIFLEALAGIDWESVIEELNKTPAQRLGEQMQELYEMMYNAIEDSKMAQKSI